MQLNSNSILTSLIETICDGEKNVESSDSQIGRLKSYFPDAFSFLCPSSLQQTTAERVRSDPPGDS